MRETQTALSSPVLLSQKFLLHLRLTLALLLLLLLHTAVVVVVVVVDGGVVGVVGVLLL